MREALTQVGKYRIERELGRGAMGVVYKGFDPVVERSVALKTIPLGIEDVEELVHRLHREAKSVGQLEHPNIVTLYDAGEAEGMFYLAMQFIDGETLEKRLARQGRFTLREVLDLFRPMCAALDYAHQRGVIHRDIKPANIMITREAVVKLTDFGIAKQTTAGVDATRGFVLGTPSYMSPEQALGKNLDGRSDIFSLGSVLYELITGEKAFPGQNTTTVMYKIVYEAPVPILSLQPRLDPEMEGIIAKVLAKKPEERFQTCAELAESLEHYVNMGLKAADRSRPPTGDATIISQEAYPVAETAASPLSATGGKKVDASYAAKDREGSSARVKAGTAPALSGVEASGSAPIASPAEGPAALEAGSGAAALARPPHQVMNWVWVGFGVLGAMMVVVVVLLVTMMRHPAPKTDAGRPPQDQGSALQSEQQTAKQSPANPQTPGTPPEVTKGGEASQVSTEPVKEVSPSPPRRAEHASARPRQTTGGQLSNVQKPAAPTTSPTSGPGSRIGSQKITNPAPTSPGISAPATGPKTAPPSAPAAAEDFNSLVLKGDLAFQQSQYQDALDAYTKAYALNQRNREVRRKIAVTLTLLGRPEEAQKYK